MLTHRTCSRGLLAASSAVAALEFALIAPVAGIMLLGTYNISRAIVLWEEVQNTAHLVAVSATTVSDVSLDPSSPRQTSITDAAAQQSLSIIYAQMPWLANGVETGIRSVTLSSIGFVPVPAASNCQVTPSQNCFTPYVAFSVAYAGGSLPGAVYFKDDASVLRGCGTAIAQILPAAGLQAKQTWQNTLRTAAVAQPDAIMVADVDYAFSPYLPPLISSMFPQTIDFHATNMWPARIGPFNLPPGQQYTLLKGTGGTGPCPPPPPSNS